MSANMANANLLYNVKIETTRTRTNVTISHPLLYTRLYNHIHIWVDNVVINEGDWVEFDDSTEPCKEIIGIYYINDAHQRHLHALYLAEFRANMARITEELVAAAMHPRRLTRHLELGGEIDDW